MSGKGEFYSNREIYEMLMAEKGERLKLSEELKLTRQYIQQYNSLRKEIQNHSLQIKDLQEARISLEQTAKGRHSAGQAILNWGGLAFGLIATGVLLIQFFKGS